MNKNKIKLIENAIEQFKNGKMLIVVDDKDRENEGTNVQSSNILQTFQRTAHHPPLGAFYNNFYTLFRG